MSLEIPGPRIILIDKELQINEKFTLEGSSFQALLLREPRRGEAITVVDQKGKEFRARLLEITSEKAKAIVFEEQSSTEPSFELWLLQALPDKERMEFIIQKTTELGVHVIIPFKSSRSISLEEREARQRKAHRWPQVALRATKQCRRAFLPYVAPYCDFKEALKSIKPSFLKIMLYENAHLKFREALATVSKPEGIALLVGPEGGWTEEEVDYARKEGFLPCKVGNRILRTETAAIVACALILFHFNEL
jgi:16S rRNA (uracil1498-N3)-methyltransferase